MSYAETEFEHGVREWRETGDRCGWEMPTAARWKRLPVVRHVRAIRAAFAVERHYRAFPWGIRTGYDEWVLWGMAHGLERNELDGGQS